MNGMSYVEIITNGNPSPRVLSSEKRSLDSELAMVAGIFFNIL